MIKALKNSDTIIDPWGTPNNISAKELYEEVRDFVIELRKRVT